MDKFNLKKYLAEGKLLKENNTQKINTNVYYVEEYNDFNQEAVPEYEIDDVKAMLRSNEKNRLYIKKGTKGDFDGKLFTTDKGSDTRVKPEYITEGLFGREAPQDVKAEKYKGYPKELNAQYFTVDADGREYDEERYIADESEGWGKDKVFALASDDEYYIFKLGSKEHIENYNSKSFDHLTKVSERAFKRFLKKFN